VKYIQFWLHEWTETAEILRGFILYIAGLGQGSVAGCSVSINVPFG